MPKLIDEDVLLEEELEANERNLRTKLSAAAIDEASGIVRGCTVAQANVEAAGKFVLLDASGKITRDPGRAVRKLPVWTDEKTLDTLMNAIRAAGGVLKVRSDHDDSLAARAGFADSFRIVEENGSKRTTGDLHLAKSYRDREIFLETAKTTPKLVGLSIDFLPEYEIAGDRALMRVVEVSAVDIVDEGAITREGLFLARRVDNRAKFQKTPETKTTATMADDKKTEKKEGEPTMSEMLSQMTALATGVKSCMEGLAALQKQMSAASAAPAGDKKEEKAPDELAAVAKEAREQLAALKAEREQLAKDRVAAGKEKAALGLKDEKAASAADLAEEREKLAKGKDETPKTYLELVAEAKASGKFAKGSDAHSHVMKAHPEAYRLHLAARNIYDEKKDNAKASR